MEPVDRTAATRAISAFLAALGYDPSSRTLAETPERVAAAFVEDLLSGERVALDELVGAGSEPLDGEPPGLVLVRDIPVTSVCPHHLLPAVGRAVVAYLPGTRLLGLGTAARLVDACARRLALQEDVGRAVVQALLEHAGARGAFCKLELLHTCLSARHGSKPEARLVTLSDGGALSGPDAARTLALALAASS